MPYSRLLKKIFSTPGYVKSLLKILIYYLVDSGFSQKFVLPGALNFHFQQPAKIKKALCERIAALGGARKLAYLPDMSRILRSVRLALHPARLISQYSSNFRNLINLLFFLTVLVLLQQGIARATMKVDAFQAQSDLIAEKNIDPSAMFYTESKLALAAEKEVRNRISSK